MNLHSVCVWGGRGESEREREADTVLDKEKFSTTQINLLLTGERPIHKQRALLKPRDRTG